MQATRITLHTEFHVGPVNERLFGGFLEHIGRAVNATVKLPPLSVAAMTFQLK